MSVKEDFCIDLNSPPILEENSCDLWEKFKNESESFYLFDDLTEKVKDKNVDLLEIKAERVIYNEDKTQDYGNMRCSAVIFRINISGDADIFKHSPYHASDKIIDGRAIIIDNVLYLIKTLKTGVVYERINDEKPNVWINDETKQEIQNKGQEILKNMRDILAKRT